MLRAEQFMKITNDSLIAAGVLFEKENGNELDQYSIRLIEKEGLTNSDPSELTNSIINYLKSASNDDPLLESGIFALSKRYDSNLKDLFVEMLRRTLDANPNALYQALIALDNLEENVLPDGGCINEYERNKRLAEKYLKNVA